MALDTYANLQAALEGWLNRADYAAQIPDFIRMAEAEFDRVLRTPDMEARATATTTAGNERVTLPTDFAGVKSITLLTDPAVALEGTTVAGLHEAYGRAWQGQPKAYAVGDGQLWFGPIPDGAYSVQIVYFRRLPRLSSSNTSNWLLAAHPDLYLMGSLLQAEFYGWNDGRLPLIRARVGELYEQIARDGLRRTTPAHARMRHGVVNG